MPGVTLYPPLGPPGWPGRVLKKNSASKSNSAQQKVGKDVQKWLKKKKQTDASSTSGQYGGQGRMLKFRPTPCGSGLINRPVTKGKGTKPKCGLASNACKKGKIVKPTMKGLSHKIPVNMGKLPQPTPCEGGIVGNACNTGKKVSPP